MMSFARHLVLVVAAALILAVACGRGAAPALPSPTAPAPKITPILTVEPSEAVEAVAPVNIGERVTFYGADPGDSAMGLAAGDFNGDGTLDVVLTAAMADGPDNARPDAGEAYVFLGPFQAGEVRDAAAGEQDVTIFGRAAGDQMGRAVAAGDVNGDGIDDIVLGAPMADPEGVEDAGVTYLILGERSLPAEIDLVREINIPTIYGGGREDLSGFALAVADVSGDGLDDIVIGAFWGDGPQDSRSNAGEVYVVFGRSSPGHAVQAPADVDLIVYGRDADDSLGEVVAAADLDGDGIAELALPAPFAAPLPGGPEEAGETYLIRGGQELTATVEAEGGIIDLADPPFPLYSVPGDGAGDQLGHSLAAGDVDGDGAGDLLLAAVSADGPGDTRNLAGEAKLIRGLFPGGIAVLIYGADAGDRLGRSAAMGDLNGDGKSDLLIAATGGDGADGRKTDAGEVSVLLGRRGLSGVVDLREDGADLVIEGLDAGDVLGHNSFGRPSLLAIDMNNDGRDEVLVAACGDGGANDRPDAGEAYIIFLQR